MTDAEFLNSLLNQASGPRLALPRADLLRLLRLAGLGDTNVYRAAATDGRDTQEFWASNVLWLVRVAAKERTADVRTEVQLREVTGARDTRPPETMDASVKT